MAWVGFRTFGTYIRPAWDSSEFEQRTAHMALV